MFTKMIAAVVMTGALWVAGDAAYQKFGCCNSTSCTVSEKSDCCSTGSSCCAVAKSSCCSATNTSCCDAVYSYCTQSGEIYLGSCCEIVDGQYRCLVTGTVSDENCCIPLVD